MKYILKVLNEELKQREKRAHEWYDKYRFAYMRSGTCRMLKFSTNVSVPFLIYAVMCSCGYLAVNLN